MIQYLIGTVLKKGLVNIVYGPSGSNKTTWVLQQLSALSSGQPFLDEFEVRSEMLPTHYIALDRAMIELEDKLEQFSVKMNGKFTYESLANRLKEVPNVDSVLQRAPTGTKLLIIDGIGFAVEGKKLIEQRGIGLLMSACLAWCEKHGGTIILIHHTAKAKIGQGYGNAREKAAGSGAWAQMAGVSISIEPTTNDIECPDRDISIMQNNMAGRLIKVQVIEGKLTQKVELTDKEQFTRADLEELYPDTSPTTLSRWISDWIQSGIFERVGKGQFSGILPDKKKMN